MGEDAEIVKEFLVESYENLDRLDQHLVVLEKEPGNRDTLARGSLAVRIVLQFFA